MVNAIIYWLTPVSFLNSCLATHSRNAIPVIPQKIDNGTNPPFMILEVRKRYWKCMPQALVVINTCSLLTSGGYNTNNCIPFIHIPVLLVIV